MPFKQLELMKISSTAGSLIRAHRIILDNDEDVIPLQVYEL